jgi:hypothetical protein
MKFGLFTEFESPAGMDQAVAFDKSLAQMKAAEEHGLDAVSLAEIHLNCGGQIRSERILTSMRLFAEQVIPRLA